MCKTDTLLLVQPLENRVWNVKTDSLAKSMRDILRFRQQSSKNVSCRFVCWNKNVSMLFFFLLDFSSACSRREQSCNCMERWKVKFTIGIVFE